jgi:hypothetical protein
MKILNFINYQILSSASLSSEAMGSADESSAILF